MAVGENRRTGRPGNNDAKLSDRLEGWKKPEMSGLTGYFYHSYLTVKSIDHMRPRFVTAFSVQQSRTSSIADI